MEFPIKYIPTEPLARCREGELEDLRTGSVDCALAFQACGYRGRLSAEEIRKAFPYFPAT
jgi:hypothetical protein